MRHNVCYARTKMGTDNLKYVEDQEQYNEDMQWEFNVNAGRNACV